MRLLRQRVTTQGKGHGLQAQLVEGANRVQHFLLTTAKPHQESFSRLQNALQAQEAGDHRQVLAAEPVELLKEVIREVNPKVRIRFAEECRRSR